MEIVLVVGILVAITAMAIPTFVNEIQRNELEGSARQMRSLLTMVGANAALDGVRYRVRFPQEDEEDPLGGDTQPLIEREDFPIEEPEEFYLVTAPWAIGNTLLGNVWCAEVRLGRPTVDSLRLTRSEVEDTIEEAFEDFEPERPPLLFDPDSTCEWATFVLTDAPRDINLDDLEDYPCIEVILEGSTGLSWLQRPLYEEELDLFEEKNWPVVLRQDLLSLRELTEDDMLELREALLD